MICKIYTLRLNENEGCIIVEDEAGEMLASSGCEKGIPTLSTQFCQAWIENPLPEVEIWESDVADISNAYTEEFGYLFPLDMDRVLHDARNNSEAEIESYYSKLSLEEAYGNPLPKIPSEIQTFTDKYGNVYDSLQACEEGEHFSKQVDKLMDEQVEKWNDEKEARINLIDSAEKLDELIDKIFTPKHKLVKRKDLPKRVDFEMLVNSSHLIWNAGHLLGLGQDPNNEVVTEGQEAVKNLELFFKLISNTKFATKASFEIEKYFK